MAAVFLYEIAHNGTQAAASYPLGESQYPCKFNASQIAAEVKSFGYIQGDEKKLKLALASIGPLSVGINGGINSFFNYGSGVYDDEACDENINRAVLLIGYGTDFSYQPPMDYWIIKNSWSSYWGEEGYMRLERGVNRCGISNYVVYPVV
jgi:C1A family cysteine protease